MALNRQRTHTDVPLTNLSIMYTQEAGGFVSDKLFPVINTDKDTNTYYEYDKHDFFKTEVKLRADKTKSTTSEYNIKLQKPYLVQVYALNEIISDREIASADEPLNLRQDAVLNLTNQMLLFKEKFFLEGFFKAGLWSTDIIGDDAIDDIAQNKVLKITDPASDPVTMIRTLKRKMLRETGKKPNKILMTLDVFDAFMENEEVKSRIKVTQDKIASKDLLAKLFEIDKIVVTEAIISEAHEGEEADMNFIGGEGKMLLMYTPQVASLRSASAGYTFNWTKINTDFLLKDGCSITSFYDKEIKSEKIEAEVAFDMKLTCKDLGIFLYGLV